MIGEQDDNTILSATGDEEQSRCRCKEGGKKRNRMKNSSRPGKTGSNCIGLLVEAWEEFKGALCRFGEGMFKSEDFNANLTQT